MNDYDAFKAYAETHHNCVFLVDTFDTLEWGSNAIYEFMIKLSIGVALTVVIWPTY